MTHADLESFAMAKNGVTKEYPFDDKTAVYKVMGKMFLLIQDAIDPLWFNVKCEPLYALELRSMYESVTAGYHMNKKHWNSIMDSGELSNEELFAFIDHSYECVVKGLTKKQQKELQLC